MTLYELIKQHPQGAPPAKWKDAPRDWQRAVRVYEYWLDLCTKMCKMDAYDLTGEHFFMTDENVRIIVRKMRKEGY